MNTKTYQFQKLTPVTSADIKVYEEAIDFVFENPDIHNVAISGAYSAGKSSLIESYKAKHGDRKFLNISLTHFVPGEEVEQQSGKTGLSQEIDDQGNPPDSLIKESVLEGKILNQLLQQIAPDKLPQSNFKVKQKVNSVGVFWSATFTLVCILSVLRISLRHQLQNFSISLEEGFIKSIVVWLSQPGWIICAAIICSIYALWIMYKIIWMQKNKSIFKRINLSGNEIEIFENQDESYFDKYLNEVLYLFENADVDVIVFEDIDRFNTSQIFERLHEINRLVNARQKKANGKTLRFFYLLRDDMFVSKDRTKFFDFIIPVVPVIDGSNSYNKFLEFFRSAGYQDHFDQSFLQSLALYVDDMRILKNICNEFIVYISRINTIDLDWNKMLALITYKNIFPRDFSDLQIGKGFVYELFDRKKELAEGKLKTLRDSQTRLKDDINYLKWRVLISPQELKDAQDAENDRYGRIRYSCTEEERAQHNRYQEDIERRKTRIQDIQSVNLQDLAKILSEVEYQILHTKTASLKDLVTRENIDQLFTATYTNEIDQVRDFHEIKSSNYFDLLKFLIRNGHIDETYADYMTYFYEDSVSAHDKVFLRRVTDQQGANYTYSLKDPEKVAQSEILRTVEFEREETLNFDLLNYLLEHLDCDTYQDYVNVLIEQLKKKRKLDFISQYYDLDISREQFVKNLNEQWNGFIKTAINESEFTKEQIKRYSIDTLYYSDPEIIKAVNQEGCLCKYISETDQYLAIDQPDTPKLIERFKLLAVKIENMIEKGVDPNLLNGIYQQNLYALNAENINFFLQREYGIKDEGAVKHRNYTLVTSKDEEPLCKYIMENLENYTTVMFSMCEGEIWDTECAAIDFLNQKTVEKEQKAQYIDYLRTQITELSAIEDTALWIPLMEKEKIAYSAENMFRFYLKFGFTDLIVNYINHLPLNCDFTKIDTKFEDKDKRKLFSAIIKNDSIEIKRYEMILRGLGLPFAEFDYDKIEDDKFGVLIQSGILRMDAQTLQFVRNRYPVHRLAFIKHNIEHYIELQSRNLTEPDEIEIVISGKITDENKLRLLELTSRSISILKKEFSDQVAAYILEHNYKASDFDELCKSYSLYGLLTKNQIIKKAIESQYQIYCYCKPLDNGLLSEMLNRNEVNRAYKIPIFINNMPNMSEENLKQHLNELGMSKLCHIFEKHGGSYNYDKTDETTQILDGLKKHRIIYDYTRDDRNTEKYVVKKNPPRKNAR